MSANILASMLFIFGSLVLVLPLGLTLALILNEKKIRLGPLARTLILLPWVTSQIASALLWRWLLNPDFGVVPYWLELLGFGRVNVFQSGGVAMTTLVLSNMWRSVAFSMVAFLAALQAIPTNLYHAAQVDGIPPSKVFFKVTLPLITPTVLVCAVILTLSYSNIITLPLVLTGGGPLAKTEVLSIRLYREAFSYYNIGFASALAIFNLMVSIVLVIAYMWVLRAKSFFR
ncbi:MAG: sugar ABC transporter permease [Firmicutes bacterium]|nr:sugar ABC transporter permease [Bacillota bacterium]